MAEALRLGTDEDFFIPGDEIRARIAEMGAEISPRYDGEEVTVLTVLKGAKRFADELGDAMGHPNLARDSVRAKSYEGTRSTGTIRILKEPETDLSGRHLILAEDILDTGQTLSLLAGWLYREYSPASLLVATMLEKPARRLPDTPIGAEVVVGIRINDAFVVGYGLDYDEEYRDLDYITTCVQQPNGLWVPQTPHEYAPA